MSLLQLLRVFMIAALIGGTALAQSPSPAAREVPVNIQMPNAQISDFIKLYQSITRRKVWIDAQVRFDRRMSISTEHPLPRAEAVSLIREELRKQGVEIREVGESEAYVSTAVR